MPGYRKTIFVSEIGWRGIRELSLETAKTGMPVDVILKGALSREILEMIKRPDGYRIMPVPRIFFRIFLFFYLMWNRVFNDVDMAVVSRPQTKKWVEAARLRGKLLVETESGYKLV